MRMTIPMTWWWPRRRQSRRLQHWAVTTTPTADGVRLHLSSEFAITVDATVDLSDDEVLGASSCEVELALKRMASTLTVDVLPGPGEVLELTGLALPAGVRLDYVVVSTANVEVSPELHRLVGARTAIGWT